MNKIRNDIAVLIKTISQVFPSLSGNSQISSSMYSGATNMSLMPSPYVEHNDETKMTFTYGLSRYGGEDVVVDANDRRQTTRRFLTIRD